MTSPIRGSVGSFLSQPSIKVCNLECSPRSLPIGCHIGKNAKNGNSRVVQIRPKLTGIVNTSRAYSDRCSFLNL